MRYAKILGDQPPKPAYEIFNKGAEPPPPSTPLLCTYAGIRLKP